MWQLINPTIDILLISIGIAAVSQLFQMKFTDRKKMRAMQKEMKDKQKRMRELAGKTDANALAEIKKLEQEMMHALNESMKHSMGSMIKLMPLTVIFLFVYWLLGSAYGSSAVPTLFPISIVKPAMGWIWWYVICVFIASIVISALTNAVENRMESKAQGVAKNG
ncbi:MAG: DUF106 domain-containing protein [Candidatus Diapherotrites archaeon]|nr:DUF106 domain-containing protein [Candidatus Diapherotrites archaeon]